MRQRRRRVPRGRRELSPLRIRSLQGQAPRRRGGMGPGAARGVPYVRRDVLAENRILRTGVQGDRTRGFREHVGEDRHNRQCVEERTGLRYNEG